MEEPRRSKLVTEAVQAHESLLTHLCYYSPATLISQSTESLDHFLEYLRAMLWNVNLRSGEGVFAMSRRAGYRREFDQAPDKVKFCRVEERRLAKEYKVDMKQIATCKEQLVKMKDVMSKSMTLLENEIANHEKALKERSLKSQAALGELSSKVFGMELAKDMNRIADEVEAAKE